MRPMWVCRLRLSSANRPGVLARIAQPFAVRGLSLDEVLATECDGQPTILVRFAATDRLAEHLRRRLSRMPEVVAAELLADPGRKIWEFAR
jgi:hypothetical protein